MKTLLLIIYILILVFQIKLLKKSIKNNKDFYKSLLLEVLSCIIAIGATIFFDKLPGSGSMPGLTYIAEYIFSLGAAIIYYIMFMITICTKIIVAEKNKKQQGKKHIHFFALTLLILMIIIIFSYIGCLGILPNILY